LIYVTIIVNTWIFIPNRWTLEYFVLFLIIRLIAWRKWTWIDEILKMPVNSNFLACIMHPPRIRRVRNSHYFGNIILYTVYIKSCLFDDILLIYFCIYTHKRLLWTYIKTFVLNNSHQLAKKEIINICSFQFLRVEW